MRTDFVLSLEGEIFWVSDRKDEFPVFELALLGGSRTVIRVIVDEPLTAEEEAEIVESFPFVLNLPSGDLDIATRYDEEDEDDAYEDDSDNRVLKVGKGKYRVTVHTTFAGPAVPNKIEKETVEKYFTRTHPGEAKPSWLESDEDSEDFWVGLILRLETDTSDAPAAKRGKVIQPGKGIVRPAVCPPGLLSDKPLNWENYVQTDLLYIHKIPKLVAKLQPEPVEGGPVSIAIRDLTLPYWIAWVCGETHPWVAVKCPPSFTPDWPGFKKGIKETKTPGGWQIDIEGSNARWTQFGHLRQVAELLSALPDGSHIELACASDDGEGKKGRQLYLGSVANGQWRIEQTFPRMKADVLADMLEIVRQGETGTTVRARDEKEADAIAKAIQTKDFLLRETPPVRKGTVFQISQKNSQLMPFLVARALQARYPKVLPMIDRDDDLGEWDSAMDMIAEAGARFATGALVFDGKFAKFTVSSIQDVDDDETVAENHEWLIIRGFEPLGNLNSTQTFQAVFRGYALAEEPVYAAMIANGFGIVALDFYTKFPDGFSLTTSAGERADSEADKKKKHYRNEMPGGLDAMWEKHQESIEDLSKKHGAPAHAGDLVAFAAELDDFFCRAHGIV